MGVGAKMIRGWLVLNSLIDFFPLCISPNFLGAGPAFDMLATDIYPLATPPTKKGGVATPIELGSFGARQVGYFFFLCGILRCLGGVNGAKDPTAALLAATSYVCEIIVFLIELDRGSVTTGGATQSIVVCAIACISCIAFLYLPASKAKAA